MYSRVPEISVVTQPGKHGEAEKVREFENFNAESNFHANFKTKLLNIQSYIGTLNHLFLIFLSLKVKFYSISPVIETF